MTTAEEPPKETKPAEPEIILSAEQEAVVTAVKSGRNVLITGSAGTGKSTLLKAITKRRDGRLPVTASTGIAAVNVGGMTLHSWTGIGLGDEQAERIAARIKGARREPYGRITGCGRLAIDEISMVSASLFNKLDTVFQIVRENNMPFGGMQIIMFGDFLQLPPVIKPPDDTREGRFAFQSESWRRCNVHVAVLTKVFRQTDEVFSGALNQIRVGEVTGATLELLRSRVKAPDPDSSIEPVIVHTHNIDVDIENNDRLKKLPGSENEYRASDWGRPNALATLQKNCLAPETLRLREGAQVMLLKNLDPLNGLANGSIGKVVSFGKVSKLPRVKFASGPELELDRESWEIKEDDKVIAERRQIPLRLAWAITVHKSQGMTLDKIRVHLANAFEFGQAYVALSRARTLAGLFIENSSQGCIKAHPEAVEFYRRALA